jgi:hypothetical protein
VFVTGGTFNKYYDLSSVMSVAMPKRLNPLHSTAWRGVTSFHLFHLGVLTEDLIHWVNTTGTFPLMSLSRNSRTGHSAARVQVTGGQIYWVEWREPVNQDQDLSFTLCNCVLRGSLVRTLLVRHAVTESLVTELVCCLFHAISTNAYCC